VIPGLKFLRLALGFVALQPIALLEFARENLGVSFHLIDLVVSEFAPLLFDLALQLREIALDSVFVHDVSVEMMIAG
jgi:hypothetical protein